MIDMGLAMFGSGVLGAGGSILGGIFGSSAASKQAAETASRTALELDNRARADMAPFRQLGIQAGPTLMGLLDGSTDVSQYLQASPMFQFQTELGERNINRQLAARGQYNSGAGLETLAMFNKGLVAEEGQRIYDRLFGVTQLGANAASATAQLTNRTGMTLANLAMESGNALGQAYAQRSNALGGGLVGAFATAGQGLASYPGAQSLMDYLERSSALYTPYAPVQSIGTLSSFTSGGTPFLVNTPSYSFTRP